jgi:NTP pyrophosphatase (non-canonical NTP hydrolase)
LRTENLDYNTVLDRLRDTNNIRMLHALLGLLTEVGELADQFKKVIFYGKELDTVNLREEHGDLNWYNALLADVIKNMTGQDFETTLKDNIAKLAKRYPNKFSEADALNRDTKNELSHFTDSKLGEPHKAPTIGPKFYQD